MDDGDDDADADVDATVNDSSHASQLTVDTVWIGFSGAKLATEITTVLVMFARKVH